MIGHKAVDCVILIRRSFEDVAKSSSRENDFFAGTFWFKYRAAVEDLGSPDRGYEWADRGEEGVETGPIRGLRAFKAHIVRVCDIPISSWLTVWVQTQVVMTRHAFIARGVDDCLREQQVNNNKSRQRRRTDNTHKTQFSVFVTLSNSIEWSNL